MNGTRLQTVFCDDIREEVGNKRSLMGIYQGEMFIQSLPVLLPRLCFYISYVSDFSKPREKVEFKVVKGADEEELFSTGVIDAGRPVTNENNLGVPYLNSTLTLAFGMSPFMIDSETVIRIVAISGAEKVLGPCLRVRLADNQIAKNPVAIKKPKIKPTKVK